MSVHFEDLSARELAAAIRGREISAREALDAHYPRIEAFEGAAAVPGHATARL